MLSSRPPVNSVIHSYSGQWHWVLKDQLAVLLEHRIGDVKKNLWRLKFDDRQVPIQDLAAVVVGIVKEVDVYVSDALSTNPYASIAWAGVGLLLRLLEIGAYIS